MQTKLEYTCAQCLLPFLRSRKASYEKREKSKYCSKACYSARFNLTVKENCGCCGSLVVRQRKALQSSKSGHVFCNRSCSATYNNTHKSQGYRRSKLEIWLETTLPILFPGLDFSFNKTDAINSELDIYIPSLKLAFELNGIFHYEPIYGANQLKQIQNNDGRKFQACAERQIAFCVIDTSGQKKFTEASSQKYLKIIQDIIEQHLKLLP